MAGRQLLSCFARNLEHRAATRLNCESSSQAMAGTIREVRSRGFRAPKVVDLTVTDDGDHKATTTTTMATGTTTAKTDKSRIASADKRLADAKKIIRLDGHHDHMIRPLLGELADAWAIIDALTKPTVSVARPRKRRRDGPVQSRAPLPATGWLRKLPKARVVEA